MHYYRSLFLIVICIVGNSTFCQQSEPLSLDSFFVFTGVKNVSKAGFYRYRGVLIKQESLTKNQIKLIYPEEVLQALINATDNSWIDHITEEGDGQKFYKKESHYTAMSEVHPDSLFFRLRCKMIFPVNGRETVLLKYSIVDKVNEREFTSIKAVVQEGKFYKLSSAPLDMRMGFALTYLKDDVLEALFLRKKIEGYETLYDEMFTAGVLDIAKIGQTFSKWYNDQVLYKEEIEHYTTKK